MRRIGAWGTALIGTLALGALGAPGAAPAAVPSVLAGATFTGAGIPCTTQTDGVRVCHGDDSGAPAADLRFKGVGGTPLEVYVILPPAPASGPDGGYPLIVQNHGYGQSAEGPQPSGGGASEYLGPTADTFAREGFAVLQLTVRGFGDSCGKATTPAGLIDCGTGGYIRLDDDRYEARDVQNAVGDLVDEGLVDPAHIGTTGESYGGGISMQLATLKDRVMDPDGTLHPWRSPNGTPLSFAASAPVIPWSDLAYSLLPNGHTLDFHLTGSADDLSPVGIPKQSFIAGLYALGAEDGNYAPPGTDPQGDISTWFGEINSPTFESDPRVPGILDQIAHYHSAYYLLNGRYGYPQEAPPPMLIANGFTDDLFPVDEALRYANLVHSLYPSDPISLFDWDGGHMRGQNKKADNALLASRINSFFELRLKGSGSAGPAVEALTQTCPKSAPSGGPFTAASWAALHPGEVDYTGQSSQTISSTAGDPTVSKAFDPVAGGGACATAPATDQGSGVATFRLPAATGSGYTLLGSPTVLATLKITGQNPEVAERLLDVDPATNTETLVARGVYRPTADGYQVFQLHPGAWHFAAGHIPKLELLGQDTPYVRASSGQFSIAVSGLSLRLPVHEAPHATGTPPVVHKPLPAPHVTPAGCGTPLPSSRIAKRRSRVSRTRQFLQGTAGERPCPRASARTRRRERVRAVYIMIIRPAAHGRCYFVTRSGRLSGLRSCARPLEFRARGTANWTLRLRLRLAPGYYLIRSDAVDGFGHHQRRSAVAAQVFRLRRHR